VLAEKGPLAPSLTGTPLSGAARSCKRNVMHGRVRWDGSRDESMKAELPNYDW
jgi:hypothetical protein